MLRHSIAGLSVKATASIGGVLNETPARMTSAPDVRMPGEVSLWPVVPRLRVDCVAASLALHLGVIAALISVVAARLPESPAETPLAVDVIGMQAFEAIQRTASASAPPRGLTGEAIEPEPSVARPAASRQDNMVRPSLMLSAQALRAPHNRALRRQLAGLADDEKIAQICDLEAMEQIHLWKPSLQPDRLVDYALSDPRMEGSAFVAKGAAFRSAFQWHEVSYRCELDDARREVVGFTFRVGDPIPRAEWSALNLPTVH